MPQPNRTIPLDKGLIAWLSGQAKAWQVEIDTAAEELGCREIENRRQTYPAIAQAFSGPGIDLAAFRRGIKDCWTLGARTDAIRLNRFLEHGDSAKTALANLVAQLPDGDTAAAQHIDRFIDMAIEAGYDNQKGSRDYAGAALLASVILCACYPERFVDYRNNRWRRWSQQLGYRPAFASKASYGLSIVWASTLGQEIAATPTFGRYWGGDSPTWTVSGLCWSAQYPERMPAERLDPAMYVSLSYQEGTQKLQMHLRRERSSAVVRMAKEQHRKKDPLMKCQVCGFSYVEAYGELGRNFIEAHHTRPIHTLREGDTTKVEDIALLCANCHRMVHQGAHVLTLDELHDLLRHRKS